MALFTLIHRGPFAIAVKSFLKSVTRALQNPVAHVWWFCCHDICNTLSVIVNIAWLGSIHTASDHIPRGKNFTQDKIL